MSRRGRTLIGVVLVGGALAYLAGAGIGDNLVYFLTPTELLARGEAAYEAPFRVSGVVEPGSVRWDPANVDLRFRIRDEDTVLEVRSSGAPPQMFQDGIDVVVEGSLGRDGVFVSRNLMVKHSNEYGPGEGAEHPETVFPALRDPGGAP